MTLFITSIGLLSRNLLVGGGSESRKQEGHKSYDYEAFIGTKDGVPHEIDIIYHGCLVVLVAL